MSQILVTAGFLMAGALLPGLNAYLLRTQCSHLNAYPIALTGASLPDMIDTRADHIAGHGARAPIANAPLSCLPLSVIVEWFKTNSPLSLACLVHGSSRIFNLVSTYYSLLAGRYFPHQAGCTWHNTSAGRTGMAIAIHMAAGYSIFRRAIPIGALS
jgi:hypothetical protein